MGKQWKQWQTLFFWVSRITADGWLQPWNKKTLTPWKKSYDQPRQHIKKQKHYFANKSPSSQGYGFSGSHVWIWELDYKESWAPKNCCFWRVVLEKTLENPLDCKEIQPVHPKGNQSWIFIGRTYVEAETPIIWPPDAKNWLIWKDPDAGKDWRWEKGMTGWNSWMASPTQWTWVWVNSRSWWWTGRPGVLQSIGSQRVGHDWATELNWDMSNEPNMDFCLQATYSLVHKNSYNKWSEEGPDIKVFEPGLTESFRSFCGMTDYGQVYYL